MADNVAITAGSGTTVMADEFTHGTYGLGKAQVIKMVIGAPDAGIDVIAGNGATTTGTQRVTISSDSTGTVAVTNAGTFATQSADLTILQTSLAPVTATFTPAASSHTAGMSVGGAQTFTSIGASAKQIMIVKSLFTVSSSTVPTSSFTLWLFNAAPTVVADAAAFGVLVADLSKFLGKISLGTPAIAGTVGTATISSVQQDALAIPVVLTTANIVAYLTNDTTFTTVAQAHAVTLYTVPMS